MTIAFASIITVLIVFMICLGNFILIRTLVNRPVNHINMPKQVEYIATAEAKVESQHGSITQAAYRANTIRHYVLKELANLKDPVQPDAIFRLFQQRENILWIKKKQVYGCFYNLLHDNLIDLTHSKGNNAYSINDKGLEALIFIEDIIKDKK